MVVTRLYNEISCSIEEKITKNLLFVQMGPEPGHRIYWVEVRMKQYHTMIIIYTICHNRTKVQHAKTGNKFLATRKTNLHGSDEEV